MSWSYMTSSLTGSSVPQVALVAFCLHQVDLPKFPEHFLLLHCDLGFLKKEGEKEGEKGRRSAKRGRKEGERGKEEGTR